MTGGNQPVRLVRMLLIPEWPAAAHRRDALEVLHRRWRAGGPLQGEGIPRIVCHTYRRLGKGLDQIEQEDEHSGDQEQYADASRQVQAIPAEVRRVGILATRHTQ